MKMMSHKCDVECFFYCYTIPNCNIFVLREKYTEKWVYKLDKNIKLTSLASCAG